MKRGVLAAGFLIVTIITSGCMVCDYIAPGDYQPFYSASHLAATNITIECYDDIKDTVVVTESATTNITVSIKTRNSVVVASGVHFNDNNDSQQVFIGLVRRGLKEFVENNWPALIEIDVPAGTNYTISYVSEFQGNLTFYRES